MPTPAAVEHGGRVHLNPPARRLLGEPWPEEWSLDTWFDLLLGAGGGTQRSRYHAAVAAHHPWEHTVALARPDGSPFSAHLAATPFQGSVLWLLYENKAASAEATRFLSCARLAELFDQAPAFMCVMDGPEHVIECANEQCLLLLGTRDVVGKRVRDATPEVVSQGFVGMLDRVLATGEPVLGHEMPIELRRTPDAPLELRFVDFVYADDDVVDSHLRVRGVSGLRVIDASVLPEQLSGNTAAPTMVLAWRAADLILEER